MRIKIKMLRRRNLLLIPLVVVLALLLAGCGYDTGTPSMPTQQTSQMITKETDFGAGNFIRDGLISALESFARLMGFMGVGVLKWFIGSIEGFNLTREGSYRQCQSTFDAANPIDPLASCTIQVYDSFKYLPMAVLGVSLLFFLLKYTFQGLFRSNQLSITDFLNNVLITTLIAFNLDFLVTMLVDISSKLFLLILSSSGSTPVNFGEGIFGQLKDMGIVIAIVGCSLLLLLAGVLLVFGGFNSQWKAQGLDILKYGAIGVLGISTLSVTIPLLIDVMNLASGSTPSVGGGGATPVQNMDAQLNNLLKLFDLNPNLHHNDLGALLVMVLLTIPAMLSFLVIGVFFFIRVLLFLLFFLMGVPAVAARLVSETAFFFEVWWKGLIKLAATSLPIAVILRVAIEVASSISVSGDNLIQYIVLMIIITLLFGMGGLYAVWIMKSEIKAAATNTAALKQRIGSFKERSIAGGNTVVASARPARVGKYMTAGTNPAVTPNSSTASSLRTTSTVPMSAQIMTQAISTGMTQAFQRQQATTDRAVGAVLSQLSQIKVGIDEIKSLMRQMSQTDQTQEVENLLKALLEETRRKDSRSRVPAPFPAGMVAARPQAIVSNTTLQKDESGESHYSSASHVRGRSATRPLTYKPVSGSTPVTTPVEAGVTPTRLPVAQMQTPVSAAPAVRPATRPITRPHNGASAGTPITVVASNPGTGAVIHTESSVSKTTTLPPPSAHQRPVYLPSERAWRRPDGARTTTRTSAQERNWNASAAMIINPNTGLPYSGQSKRLKQQKAANF